MARDSYIRTYCFTKFKSNYRLSSDETELIVPSCFIENDYKRHMSINLETGLWRCFKTGETGNFIKLIAKLDNVPYRKAYETFVYETFLEEEPDVPKEFVISDADINPKCSLVDIYDTSHLLNSRAASFLFDRGMANEKMYICTDGFYHDRLIIPFFKDNGGMFYFQARALFDDQNPKYLNCKSLKSSYVLYPFEYDSFEPLYVTEGVFDCLSLKRLGLNATSTLSCTASNEQMRQLKHYQGPVVVAYDSDEAGLKGTRAFYRLAMKHKMTNLMFCLPPKNVKDWNEYMLSGKTTLPELIPLDRIELESYAMMNEK